MNRGRAARALRSYFVVMLAGSALMTIGSVRRAGAQISPGPLAAPHQPLDGALNCLKCHSGGAEGMDKACQSCHKPIARLEGEGRGLHARVKEQKCATCHPDHAGRSFSLIQWEAGSPEKFDHAKTGWALEGRHATRACRDCHKAAFQKSPVMADVPEEHRASSWLGLERECRSCHEDPHRGALKNDCASCHSPADWKPAGGFDHARSAFPLTGKHVEVKCADCHRSTETVTLAGAPKTMTIFKPAAHADCSNCHKDPHQGRLGATCAGCHTTDDFHKVAGDKFDHGRTRFPLSGRHVALNCAQCHDPVKAWGKKPLFDRCAVCHKDPHAGEATLARQPADCAACHDTRGFNLSTFTVERHDKAAFPLTGKHRTVNCVACHVKAAPGERPANVGIVKMRPRFDACRDCHAEVHGDQLAGRADRGACEACHTPDRWKPSRFGIPEHAQLRLALRGRHAELDCADCHGPKRKGLPAFPSARQVGKADVAFAHELTRCADCHVNVHKDLLRPAKAGEPAPACLDCHDMRAFRPSTVDARAHARYAFQLEGAHLAVPCEACHTGIARRKKSPTLVALLPAPQPLGFQRKSKLCRDCHEDPHARQFVGRVGGDDCSTCHDQSLFAPASRFDHDRDARFSLKGEHQKVPCAKCHGKRTDDSGRSIVNWRPVDPRCESCHAKGKVVQ